MKKIFGRCMDIIGHLPSSLMPSGKLEPEIKIPVKEGKRGFRVVIYDMDSPREEGMEALEVWNGYIPDGLVHEVIKWIKVQTIALQYRKRSGVPRRLQGRYVSNRGEAINFWLQGRDANPHSLHDALIINSESDNVENIRLRGEYDPDK